MGLYTKESLDHLRTRIDLVDVLSAHVQLKRSGATHKGCCPFHEEKTPSFMVQAGDTHYHCFGCGAHGDAIAFYMSHLKMTFIDAVQALAERFGVQLEKEEGDEKGPNRGALKKSLELASQLYHTLLLHTDEGHEALHYLYDRGIDLEFVKFFKLGYAPAKGDPLLHFARKEGISEEILREAGLVSQRGRDFFSERILFPVTDPFGAVIGFSGRKFKEGTFGGKYINTQETPLFKKSHILFGLSYCRRRIAKERKALIVEGQIDALKLIHEGLDYAVAGQGTAFGQGHVEQLITLGVNQIFLAMDSDDAGVDAAIKIGNLFQKKGIDVKVIDLPKGSDPDQFLRDHGLEEFEKKMLEASDYLSFVVNHESRKFDLKSPAQKNAMVQKLSEMVRNWEEPVMVHESLRKLSQLTHVPESVVGVGAVKKPSFVKRMGFVQKEGVDADRILETDLLRWLILRSEDQKLIDIAHTNLKVDLFNHPLCKRLYQCFMDAYEHKRPYDLIALGGELEGEGEQNLLSEIVGKKVNLDKAEEGLVEVINRMLTRNWMHEREEIRIKIQSGNCSDFEALQLAKQFDEIKKKQPKVVFP